MSVTEAAIRLNLSDWYVRQLCNQGILPAYKAGRSWDIPDHVLSAFIRARRNPNAAMREIER